ncbi:MAG: GumC family protein, partial [bacterium]
VVSGKTLADAPYISKLRDAIADAQLKLLNLQEKYTDTNPQVLEAKKNLDNLRRELEERLKQRTREEIGESLTLNPLQSERISAQLDIFTNEAKKKALESFVQPLEEQLSTLPDKSLAYARLQRERQTLSTLYTDLLQRLQEARIRETTTRGNAYVAETASLPTSPAFPPRNLLISTGFVLAIFLGVAAALLAEYLDDTVKAPVDAERHLGIPVLGAIPQFDTKEGELPVLTHPRSSAAESFRTLRANIKFSQIDEPLKILLITSSLKGEGKTLVASNLALAYSTGGAKTLLLDCDMRHPGIHHLFNLENDRGLTNVLVGEAKLEECVREVGENLFVLTSGPVPPNPV